MPNQFTPADRSEVLEHVRGQDFIDSASKLGVGVKAVRKSDETQVYTQMVEDYGWYIAGYEHRQGEGDVLDFMPITEVNVDE